MQIGFQTLPAQQKPPKLVRFLLKNAAIGFVAAVAFVGAILTFNIGNLSVVFAQSGVGPFAIALMTFMIGLTFASLQMSFAVMFRVGDPDECQNEHAPPANPSDH